MYETAGESPWWSVERHLARRPFLAARGKIKRAIRSWFDDAGFTEVECPALQVSPGNEAHLHAFKTERIGKKVYRTRDAARADVFDYIERFYNPVRRHSTIGYVSPVEFERKVGLA